MNLRGGLVVLLLMSLVLGGCRPSSERRLVSIREGQAQPGYLQGELLYVETRGVRQSAVFIHDLWENERVRVRLPDGYADSPSWSPDGEQFAFSLTQEDGDSHIWIVDADGSRPRQMTDGDVVDDHPRWSPDGQRLVFSSIRDGDFDWRLYTVSVEDRTVSPIADQPGHSVFPEWMPDGRFIAYSNRSGEHYQLRLIDLEEETDRELTSADLPSEDLYARADPDGSGIYFATDRDDDTWQIWRYDLATNQETRIIGSDTMDEYPAASPDNQFIAFSTGHLAIYRTDAEAFPDGQLRWAVTQNLAWAPDWKASR